MRNRFRPEETFVRRLRRTPQRSAMRLVRRVAFGLLTALLIVASATGREPLRFNRDVRPVLSNHCFSCHGRDERSRKAGVRLDVRENALRPAESGAIPIVPGKPEASEVVRRIANTSTDEVMPPLAANKPLTKSEQELLTRWVAEGAHYEPHWAFVPPRRPQPPAVKETSWPRNAIDNFILSRLEQESFRPSVDAEWPTLFRRLSLDLTGLPPTFSDLDAFEHDLAMATRSASAAEAKAAADRVYERWVDRLLGSPQFGERMAVDWLDAARFADTNGYQVDRDRDLTAWRDWVIDAFNANQPFDQFTIEQLAGDLLPGSTLRQKIATGFHRNHMFNEESGAIPEEFVTEYCADRLETTSTVWLGLTLNCARCHDHKFDPFTQRDYYGLFAFFHNLPEVGLGNAGAPIGRTAPPFLKLPAPRLESQLASLKGQLKEVRTRLADRRTPPQNDADRKRLKDRIARLNKEIKDVDSQIPTALVMQEMANPRRTFVLVRGAYNKPGPEVTAGVPATLLALAPDLPRNRLGLACWLVDPANPLPARVTVNRLWQSLFGVGLVRTTEDFGTQGEAPSHPELLDWLATEFVRRGWDVKAMLRLLVTSSTYRQSSRLTPTLHERDPENRLLARGPRFRLQAEFLRDQALCASGLLVSKIGGPSVRPYFPPGLYEQVVSAFVAPTYVLGKGDELYRRSLYTYWKRSIPNATLLAFDAPFRETCTVRRPRTNTPLQALNMMNDPTYVEAARCLAQRMVREEGGGGGATTRQQIAHGFRLLLSRSPRTSELAILVAAHDRALKEFQADRGAAASLLKVGVSTADPSIRVEELAALTTVATTILNLDEAVTKE